MAMQLNGLNGVKFRKDQRKLARVLKISSGNMLGPDIPPPLPHPVAWKKCCDGQFMEIIPQNKNCSAANIF